MDIEKNYKRRIRIIGKPTDLAGYNVDVQDAETGESITNVERVVIVLRPTMANVAILSIIREDPDTHQVITEADGDVRRDLVRAGLPEIDVTALELMLQENAEDNK